MAIERTLSIIKPDATKRNLTGKINAKFEEVGLRIIAQKRIKLSKDNVEKNLNLFIRLSDENKFKNKSIIDFRQKDQIILNEK